MDDRRTGKTTALFEKAVYWLGLLSEDEKVFVTGAHIRWLKDLERRFKSSGLVDVVFLTPNQIRNGALRGRRGMLLVDDFDDLSLRDMQMIYREKCLLNNRSEQYLDEE